MNDEQRMAELRKFAERSLDNHRHPHIGEFYKRCLEEGSPVLPLRTS